MFFLFQGYKRLNYIYIKSRSKSIQIIIRDVLSINKHYCFSTMNNFIYKKSLQNVSLWV